MRFGRLYAALLFLLFVAVPAWARVLSYAPYTDKNAVPSVHVRSGRYFALYERDVADWWWWGASTGQLVLYDAHGSQEPRVVYPATGEVRIDASAVFHETLAETPPVMASEMPPVLLVATYGPDAANMQIPVVLVSPDGGETWQRVAALDGQYVYPSARDVDFGGPLAGGMGMPLTIGTEDWPFILTTGQGVYAVSADGNVKLLASGNASLLGRNQAGTRFLVRRAGELAVVGLDGASVPIPVTPVPYADYTGWITADGSVYLQVLRPEGRFLFLYRNAKLHFVAGPYGATPPTDPPTGGAPTLRFFAVPTSDYEGAWMIQRDIGKPTTLHRHGPAGLQTMWADVSGPQVEALITGGGGQTVLVQVHREHAVQVGGPFVDPALAVWRIGQPAPRDYDELYLNEQWNKGFVHVDVDRIEAGQPFVFNSGFNDAGDIIISPPVGGGGDVVQEWGVVRASLRQRLVLPGAGRARGAFESNWFTDVMVFNPLEVPQNVEVRFVEAGAFGAAHTATVVIGARETRVFPDVLNALFGVETGSGALHFLPESGVTVNGRVYSRKGEGTYGFGIQAIDFFNSFGPRFPLTFAGAFPGEHFRTNLLLTDTSGRGTRAMLEAFGISGPVGLEQPAEIAAPAGGVVQVNGIHGSLGLKPWESGGLMLSPASGTAIATVVAMDNRTNDPTYFPPDLPASVGRGIPVIAHTDGAHGSRFRSDLYLFNPSEEARTVVLEAKAWDSAQRKVVNFTLLPEEGRLIPDALVTLFGMQGTARVTYTTTDSVDGARVTSRTYNVAEDGGTYGSRIPPMNSFQLAAPGDTLEIHGIHGGAGFRTNVGLVDFSPFNSTVPSKVRLRIYDNHHSEIDTFEVTVPPAGGMQVNDLFGSRGVTVPEAAVIRVENLSGGVVGAYGSLVDNVTSDSTFLGAQLAARP